MDVTIRDVAPAGYALYFDGVDDLVHVARAAALEPQTITIELWAMLEDEQSRNTRLLRKAPHLSGSGYIFAADQDNDRRMQLRVHNSDLVAAEDPEPHAAYVGTWQHFAGTYDEHQAAFYVDGAVVSVVPHDNGPMAHGPLVDLFIGHGAPSPDGREHFRGYIDEVRIWNAARTPCKIAEHMHRPLHGTEPGLVGYWRFDEGAGQLALDSSPYGNHGVLGVDDAPEGDDADPQWVISGADLNLDAFAAPYWMEPVVIPEISSGNDWSVTLPRDELSVYIGSERDGFAENDIYRADRAARHQPFSTPVVVSEVSIPGYEKHDNTPEITADGLRLYFARIPGHGPGDFYVAERGTTGDPWGAPVPVAGVNTEYAEEGIAVSADELRMVFGSTRSGARRFWTASRATTLDPWGDVFLIDSLGGLSAGQRCDLSVDGLTLYVTAQGPTGLGQEDIWMLTRPHPDAPFGEPRHIAELSSDKREYDVSVSADGRTMYLVRQRNWNAGDVYVADSVVPGESVAGDLDCDFDADLDDWGLFANCARGPAVSIPPVDCALSEFLTSDADGDHDVDLFDLAVMMVSLTGGD